MREILRAISMFAIVVKRCNGMLNIVRLFCKLLMVTLLSLHIDYFVVIFVSHITFSWNRSQQHLVSTRWVCMSYSQYIHCNGEKNVSTQSKFLKEETFRGLHVLQIWEYTTTSSGATVPQISSVNLGNKDTLMNLKMPYHPHVPITNTESASQTTT